MPFFVTEFNSKNILPIDSGSTVELSMPTVVVGSVVVNPDVVEGSVVNTVVVGTVVDNVDVVTVVVPVDVVSEGLVDTEDVTSIVDTDGETVDVDTDVPVTSELVSVVVIVNVEPGVVVTLPGCSVDVNDVDAAVVEVSDVVVDVVGIGVVVGAVVGAKVNPTSMRTSSTVSTGTTVTYR